MALIENTQTRFYIIPAAVAGVTPEKVAPGFNEIPDEFWSASRAFAKDNIEAGNLVEHKGQEIKGKDGELVFKSKTFAELEFKEAQAVVKKTYYIPTLERWKLEKIKDDVRSVILTQIEFLNKEATKTKVEQDKR